MEATTNSYENIPADWDESKFSVSVNEILKEAQSYPNGVSIFFLFNLLHKKHPEYGHANPKTPLKRAEGNGIKFLNFSTFISLNLDFLMITKLTSAEIADSVLKITNVPSSPGVINGRLFLLALILSVGLDDFREPKVEKEKTDTLLQERNKMHEILMNLSDEELLQAVKKTLNPQVIEQAEKENLNPRAIIDQLTDEEFLQVVKKTLSKNEKNRPVV